METLATCAQIFFPASGFYRQCLPVSVSIIMNYIRWRFLCRESGNPSRHQHRATTTYGNSLSHSLSFLATLCWLQQFYNWLFLLFLNGGNSPFCSGNPLCLTGKRDGEMGEFVKRLTCFTHYLLSWDASYLLLHMYMHVFV